MKINWSDTIIRALKTTAWSFISLNAGSEIMVEGERLVEMHSQEEALVAIIAGIIGLIVNGVILPFFNWMKQRVEADDDG